MYFGINSKLLKVPVKDRLHLLVPVEDAAGEHVVMASLG